MTNCKGLQWVLVEGCGGHDPGENPITSVGIIKEVVDGLWIRGGLRFMCDLMSCIDSEVHVVMRRSSCLSVYKRRRREGRVWGSVVEGVKRGWRPPWKAGRRFIMRGSIFSFACCTVWTISFRCRTPRSLSFSLAPLLDLVWNVVVNFVNFTWSCLSLDRLKLALPPSPLRRHT